MESGLQAGGLTGWHRCQKTKGKQAIILHVVNEKRKHKRQQDKCFQCKKTNKNRKRQLFQRFESFRSSQNYQNHYIRRVWELLELRK